jgi:hypothetical protein
MTGRKDPVARAVFGNNGNTAPHSRRGVASQFNIIKVHLSAVGSNCGDRFEDLGSSSTDKSSETNNFASFYYERHWMRAPVGACQSRDTQSNTRTVTGGALLSWFDTTADHESFNRIAVVCAALEDAGAISVAKHNYSICYAQYLIKVMRDKHYSFALGAQFRHDF